MRKCVAAACVVALGVAGCGGGGDNHNAENRVNREARQLVPYIPHNNVEFNNVNRAQRLYDDPNTIQWCTYAFSNPSAPIVTVPIAGKLTSSSTTFFSPQHAEFSGDTGITVLPSRSPDHLFHPNPPPYRFGFTPGGQYFDESNTQMTCTTALTKQTRQKTQLSLSLDTAALSGQKRAEAALRAGRRVDGTVDPAKARIAQQALEQAVGGQ